MEHIVTMTVGRVIGWEHADKREGLNGKPEPGEHQGGGLKGAVGKFRMQRGVDVAGGRGIHCRGRGREGS